MRLPKHLIYRIQTLDTDRGTTVLMNEVDYKIAATIQYVTKYIMGNVSDD